jgi:hypothetical protein
MGRLTRKDYKKAPLHDLCGISTDCVVDCADCFVIKLYDKLAHYEDMEEQGRLITLPCAVGEEVWIGHKIYSFGESVVNVMYGSVSSIIIAMQDGFVFGRTKEEAEAKLKELEGVKE